MPKCHKCKNNGSVITHLDGECLCYHCDSKVKRTFEVTFLCSDIQKENENRDFDIIDFLSNMKNSAFWIVRRAFTRDFLIHHHTTSLGKIQKAILEVIRPHLEIGLTYDFKLLKGSQIPLVRVMIEMSGPVQKNDFRNKNPVTISHLTHRVDDDFYNDNLDDMYCDEERFGNNGRPIF